MGKLDYRMRRSISGEEGQHDLMCQPRNAIKGRPNKISEENNVNPPSTELDEKGQQPDAIVEERLFNHRGIGVERGSKVGVFAIWAAN
jgi:hypothetical protein